MLNPNGQREHESEQVMKDQCQQYAGICVPHYHFDDEYEGMFCDEKCHR
jgi:hypothetical protein